LTALIKSKPKEDPKPEDPGPGELPWASYTLIRILPDDAPRNVIEFSGVRYSPDPLGYVITFGVTPSIRLKGKKGLLPGGLRSADKSPLDTAVRETATKVGLQFPPERFTLVDRLLGGVPVSHWKYLFCADLYLSERAKVNTQYRGPGGEAPLILTLETFSTWLEKGDYFEPHRSWLERRQLLPRITHGATLSLPGPAAQPAGPFLLLQ
jgi:ADP-ribose pyrophosphatase YjhB (NUDIX family)